MTNKETNLDKIFDSLKSFLPERDSEISRSSDENSSDPYIIVGLGNPGKEFRMNRHNIGFMVLDAIADEFGISFSRVKFKAVFADTNFRGNKVILAKPQTYMNLSGQSVGSLLKFYKVPLNNLMVVYDDIDIPFGEIRIRPKGGPGGQKGVASIIKRLGTDEFPRIRVGIGRPPGRQDASSYVLEDFSEDEMIELNEVIDRSTSAIKAYIERDLNFSMNQYNTASGNR